MKMSNHMNLGLECLGEKVSELKRWQLEQQVRLKEYQEAQRKLLDTEHVKVLMGLKTQQYQTHNLANDTSDNEDLQDQVFNFEPKAIILKDPEFTVANGNSMQYLNEENNENVNGVIPHRFLRRGEGLARFRMTADDFKGVPKIYKQKNIRTYPGKNPVLPKPSRRSVLDKKKPAVSKPAKPIPVKIYPTEKKSDVEDKSKKFDQGSAKPREMKCNKVLKERPVVQDKPCIAQIKPSYPVKLYSKENIDNPKEVVIPKTPVKNLVLNHSPATIWYNAMKERERMDLNSWIMSPETKQKHQEIEKVMRKDEKELRAFELLEEKVNESSFTSEASYIGQIMNTSTPLRPVTQPELNPQLHKNKTDVESNYVKRNEDVCNSITNGVCNERMEEGVIEDEVLPLCQVKKILNEENETIGIVESVIAKNAKKPLPVKQSNVQIKDHLENIKKLKNECLEMLVESEPEGEPVPPDPKVLTQHELALKVQRKALQDNVKHLLNWESEKKKPIKRVTKKTKVKPKKVVKETKKENLVKFGVSEEFVKERVAQLEKEIQFFRQENARSQKLQKELDEERVKLEKTKKEFEKYLKEEQEKLEARISEEQRKLQREKSVFEKYCKQSKQGPSKQEREEIGELKKELEKVTEALSTKEARWGAAQARLRNQLKALEKENKELKASLESARKQTVKKVTFSNGRALNTKMIHSIGAKLGKLQEGSGRMSARQKYASLSARVDTNIKQKPLRRIRSVPDTKEKLARFEGTSLDCEEEKNALDIVDMESLSDDERPVTEEIQRQEDDVYSLEHNSARLLEIKRRMESLALDVGAGGEEMSDVVPRAHEDDELCVEEHDLVSWAYDRNVNQHQAGEQQLQEQCKRQFHDSHQTFQQKREVQVRSCVVEELRPRVSVVDERSEQEPKPRSVERMEESRRYVEPRDQSSNIEPKQQFAREVRLPSGTVKKTSPDGRVETTIYFNGDRMEVNMVDGSVKYFYAETKTMHITYKDGLEILEFANGRTERRRADGSSEATLPDGSTYYRNASGQEEYRYADGTVLKKSPTGEEVLLLPNGQREVRTKECKRREYPDGTVKLVYPDGTQETRYANGRVRLKDAGGRLLMDSGGFS